MKQTPFTGILLVLAICANAQSSPVPPSGHPFFGINSFPWVPLSKVRPFGLVRQYQMTEWTWKKDGITVAPSHGANDEHYDSLFAEAKYRGVTMVPVLSWRPAWLKPKTAGDAWQHETMNDPATDPANPLSYRQWAAYLYQWSARYGRHQHPAERLKVSPEVRWTNDSKNTSASGLDLLHYIEPENEPNRWWRPPSAQYTPEQAAAMLSAAYDGHEGQMGPLCGIKTADSTMRVVMPGLADINVAYLDAMLAWCQSNRRDQRFPADVLNVHHYCNAANRRDNPRIHLTRHGVQPEADSLRERLRDLVRWRNKNLPNVPIWLSEFGYDTHPASPQRAVPHGGRSAETVQGIWNARAYLEAMAAGVDAAFVFTAIDEPNEQSGGLFTSSGIMQGEHPQSGNPFAAKAGYEILEQLAADLAGLRFSADLSPAPEVRLYAFDPMPGVPKPRILIAWLTSASGATRTVQVGGQMILVTEVPQTFFRKF